MLKNPWIWPAGRSTVGKRVHAATVLADLHVDLAVAEPLDVGSPQGDAEERADFLRQLDVSGTREKLEPGHTSSPVGRIRNPKERNVITIVRRLQGEIGRRGNRPHHIGLPQMRNPLPIRAIVRPPRTKALKLFSCIS